MYMSIHTYVDTEIYIYIYTRLCTGFICYIHTEKVGYHNHWFAVHRKIIPEYASIAIHV